MFAAEAGLFRLVARRAAQRRAAGWQRCARARSISETSDSRSTRPAQRAASVA